jgi:hypothetical protein
LQQPTVGEDQLAHGRDHRRSIERTRRCSRLRASGGAPSH